MAAHSGKTDKPKKFTTVVQDANDPTKTVTVETTPVDPTPTVATRDTTVTQPAGDTLSTDPVEQLHQTVITQATATGQLIAPNDIQSFIDIQWFCIGRSLGENNQYLDTMSSWLLPTTNPDGTRTYKYFVDRTCRVMDRTV
jgi:hypothetical protein